MYMLRGDHLFLQPISDWPVLLAFNTLLTLPVTILLCKCWEPSRGAPILNTPITVQSSHRFLYGTGR